MRWFDFPSTVRGHFVSAVLMGLLIAGGPGCASLNLGQFFGNVGTGGGSFGFLINSNYASSVLGGINLPDGSSAFAYGRFNPDGSIAEVSGAVFTDPDGNVTQLELDGGLPSKALGPDGSRVDIQYTERTATRLKGNATLTFAPLDDADKVQTISFEVDLLQAAAQLAQQIKDLIGVNVSNQPPPEDPDGGGRIKLADATRPGGSGAFPADVAKDAAAAQAVFVLLGPAYVYAFASLGYLMVQVMGRIIAVVVEVMVNVIIGLTRAIVTAMFLPFILMGEMFRRSVNQPLILLALVHGQNAGGIWVPPAPDL